MEQRGSAAAGASYNGTNGTSGNGHQVVRFLVSSELSSQVQVKLDRLRGAFGGDGANPHAEYRVECAIYFNGSVLGIPVSTRYVPRTPGPDGRGFECVWDETLCFCVKYKDLPLSTLVALTVWSSDEDGAAGAATPVGGCALRLFSKKLRLRSGSRRLRLWARTRGDGRDPTTTPGKIPASERGQAGKLERLMKQFRQGDMPRVDLLDRLCAEKVASIVAAEERELFDAGVSCISIELRHFPLPVLFQESGAGAMAGGNLSGNLSGAGSFTAPALGAAAAAAAAAGSSSGGSSSSLITLLDPEIGRENPAERKAQRLARSEGPGSLSADRNLKPNSSERRAIEGVLRQPPTQPIGRDAKKLLWRFRYALKEDRAALSKFLMAVDWQVAYEVEEALHLIGQWATISISDALCLLSSNFKNPGVREHAVKVLITAEDEDIVNYLLQLVQALRYEITDESPLANFLIRRGCQNHILGNFLHW